MDGAVVLDTWEVEPDVMGVAAGDADPALTEHSESSFKGVLIQNLPPLVCLNQPPRPTWERPN